jgi:acetylornithine aminotransferase
VLEQLERRALLPHVERMGTLLQQLLGELVARHSGLLVATRGWGLLQGLVLRADAAVTAPELVKAALDQGLLLVPAGPTVVRFVPPLTIKRRHIREAIKRLEKALLACQAQTPSAT